jgi:glucose/arabinose dehydrogenase
MNLLVFFNNENKYKLSYCNGVNLSMKKTILIVIINFISAQLYLELLGQDFDKPIYVTTSPINSNIFYIVEQDGYIWIVDDGKELSTPFLDITDRVHKPLFPADEMGLLGFAFDPNFTDNGFIYINYNDKDDNTIISRFKTESNKVNINTEQYILRFKQPYSNHNGGHIAFDSEGYFYISVGDGGSAGDPDNRAQDLTNLFGSILRIKLNDDASYSIPKDNPFLKDNYMKEIWLYGLRNVWRFSFDRLNNDMYLGDVGQNAWEEINYISHDSKGGLNFGWNIMEASSVFLRDYNDSTLHYYQLPIFEYPNDAKYVRTILGIKQKDVHGCSVTGGYVYRGSRIPELYGRYFFGDYCTGKIWSFYLNDGKAIDFRDHTNELLDSINKNKFYLSSFGESENGELLLVDYSGSIYRISEK